MRFTISAGACVIATLCLSPASSAQRGVRIDAGELKTWLSYLASDDLQGRQVYSEGLGLAAAYIADQLKSWGVKPAGDRGGYFQLVTVHGVQTTSRSSVTVTVNGQTRTFKDGEGVTFAREQGGPQTLTSTAEAVGYGLTHAPLSIDDYAGREVKGKVAVYFGRGGSSITTAHNRLVNNRARSAVERQGAMAAIGPEPPPEAPGRRAIVSAPPSQPAPPNGPRVDFTTAMPLGRTIAPLITAGDAFFEFLLTGSGHTYADIKAKADRKEALPRVALRGAQVTITVDASYEVVQTRLTRNVAGVVEGRDAAQRGTYVLFGAHYDHVGYQQFTGTDAAGANAIADCAGQTRPTPRPGDVINNGADDDGSGTVALLALAKAFARGQRPRRSVMFVWHAGEEGGLVGSRYMAEHPLVPLDAVAAQLNIDMIGRNRCDRPSEANTVYVIGSDRISTELHNLNEDANATLASPLTLDYEFNDVSDVESYYTRSDHYSYAAKSVPVIFFFNGVHRDYHYVTDEVDKILFPKMARITELAYATAWRLANLDHLPARDNRGPRAGKGHRGRIPTP
jgi:hypothetical protein